ncbi:MAG: thiamine phosphate synthase [Pirellulaceae bacterium]
MPFAMVPTTIGCGPTFPSATKSFDSFAGVSFLRQVSDKFQIPAFAIGGIDLNNVTEVVEAGFKRVAISGVLSRSAPQDVVSALQPLLT